MTSGRIPSRYQRGIHFFRRSLFKRHVGHAVEGGVAVGIPDRRADDIHPIDALGMPGEIKGDGSDAAIGVNHGFFPGQTGVFDHLIVQDPGLHRIDLKKGVRGDGENDISDPVIDHLPAP